MGLITDVRAGCVTLLEGIRSADPTLLGDITSARPASFSLGLPAAYVGDLRPGLAYINSLCQRTGTEQDIVLVFSTFDNEEMQAKADTLTQAVLDAVALSPHFIHANSVAEVTRVRVATELDSNGTSYPAVVITVGRITYLEGGY